MTLILGTGLAILLAVVVSLISREVGGWMPICAKWIVTLAVRRLPQSQQDRWREELLSDLATFEARPISGLIHSVRLVKSVGRLRREVPCEFAEHKNAPTEDDHGKRHNLVKPGTGARVPPPVELAALIEMLATSLSPLEADSLRLYLEGSSYEQMAEELRCNTNTIDQALQRVKRKVLAAGG